MITNPGVFGYFCHILFDNPKKCAILKAEGLVMIVSDSLYKELFVQEVTLVLVERAPKLLVVNNVIRLILSIMMFKS